MQERHITTPGPVLDEHGVITPGYSERSICTYRRADIKAPFYRIKEWDFYQAVSYTHLDVYKRQPVMRPMVSAPPSRLSNGSPPAS